MRPACSQVRPLLVAAAHNARRNAHDAERFTENFMAFHNSKQSNPEMSITLGNQAMTVVSLAPGTHITVDYQIPGGWFSGSRILFDKGAIPASKLALYTQKIQSGSLLLYDVMELTHNGSRLTANSEVASIQSDALVVVQLREAFEDWSNVVRDINAIMRTKTI